MKCGHVCIPSPGLSTAACPHDCNHNSCLSMMRHALLPPWPGAPSPSSPAAATPRRPRKCCTHDCTLCSHAQAPAATHIPQQLLQAVKDDGLRDGISQVQLAQQAAHRLALGAVIRRCRAGGKTGDGTKSDIHGTSRTFMTSMPQRGSMRDLHTAWCLLQSSADTGHGDVT